MIASWTESEWDNNQRGWILALAEYRAGLCPCGCGHMLRDTISHEGDGPSFVVPPPPRCRARDALSMAQQGYKRDRPEAALWQVQKGGAI